MIRVNIYYHTQQAIYMVDSEKSIQRDVVRRPGLKPNHPGSSVTIFRFSRPILPGLAVKDGKIVFTGSNKEADKILDGDAELIDLVCVLNCYYRSG